jgi:hypothetical protein
VGKDIEDSFKAWWHDSDNPDKPENHRGWGNGRSPPARRPNWPRNPRMIRYQKKSELEIIILLKPGEKAKVLLRSD